MLTAKQLVHLGISENEARVYLAALEMGPATAQQIARKTGLSRVTSYAMIDSLTARGLVSSVEKEKKRLFAAESPERLKSLLKTQKAALEARERELDSFLPELKALAAGAKEKPTVRFYEGLEGLETMRQDLLRFRDIRIDSVMARDDYFRVVPEASRIDYRKKMVANNIDSRTIFTFSEPYKPSELVAAEIRQVPSGKFPFAAELAVYDDRVAILTYKTKPIGVVIYSKDIAETFRALFELGWEGSEKYKK
ncbi:hypothetical protein A3D72_00245 [Candidatus Uhrbacteria bacterium RIFCSPHIGHO2_02_FULL_57_19]|uniref:Transcription regulator TrmB N-terminal domain-containing protein n=1 Tax=Candidatus Uhrbacteria bacterium RIFCSPHIGHO2_02_FULL_57_19 TaxID=1802391 RepID=A0A1F7U6M1_9BACT|nr:MAG: hypothetical protein A3D72_00245 [Candidatus Uhrbacteria bacterium RIFCSPHIGHO2_02_FULL_57_19]